MNIYRVKVQSPDGGKEIPNAIAVINVPELAVGDLVVYNVHSDYTDEESEELTGMVGVITHHAEPELHLGQGWKPTEA